MAGSRGGSSDELRTSSTEANLQAYRSLRAEFDSAARANPAVAEMMEIAGYLVQSQLVGEPLALWFHRALGHLASDHSAASAHLTIRLFLRDCGPRPENSTGDSNAAGSIYSSVDGRFIRQKVMGADYLLDRTELQLVGSIEAMESIPPWEAVKPLATPLMIWLSDLGLNAIHAGLVARHGEGVLFAGPSGSGKSTCALACASQGFDFLGDDCVILDPRAPANCWGYSLYATSALEANHLEQFASPLLQSKGGEASRGKQLIALRGAAQVRTGRRASIRAIVFPRLTASAHSLIRPATKAEALRQMAPSSVIKRAVPAKSTLAGLAALVNLVPSYWLDMSHHPRDIPETLLPLIGPAHPQ
jgi:hypothetical protein